MAGWLEAFGQLAGGLGQGLDRYTALRQLDEDNKWKRLLQQSQLQSATLSQQQTQANLDLLKSALLDRKVNDITQYLRPGQDLSDRTVSQLDAINPAVTDALVKRGTTFNQPQAISNAMPIDLPQYAMDTDSQGQGFITPILDAGQDQVRTPAFRLADTPMQHNLYQGTPEQQDAQQALALKQFTAMQPFLQRQQLAQLINTPGFNVNNPMDAMKVAALDPTFDIKKVVGPDPTGGGAAGFMMNLPPDQQQAYLKMAHDLAAAQHQPSVYDQMGGTLDPDALRAEAEFALQTGAPPPMGGGIVGAKNQQNFWHTMGTMFGGGQPPPDFAGAKADAGALNDLTKTVNTVKAFHNVALKNLGVFTDAFSKLKDHGSEFLNAPLRDLAVKFNDPNGDVAAAYAASNTFLREYARITSRPDMKGQLTDNSRQEALDMIDKGYTMAQFNAVKDRMLQDLANVDSGLSEQLAALKEGITKRATNSGSTAAPTQPAPTTIHYKIVNGQLVVDNTQ